MQIKSIAIAMYTEDIEAFHVQRQPFRLNQRHSTQMMEKLFLQWNDFQENIKIAFGNLRENTDLSDATLAYEDGQQVEAHKVICIQSLLFLRKTSSPTHSSI